MQTFALVLAVVAAAWIVAVAAVWTNQERVVFHPPRVRPVEDADARRVAFTSADGTRLFAYVLGPGVPGAPVVIAFHGNADLARWYLEWAEALAARTGSAVVVPEYRGYDGIAGPPTCAGVREDARAALALVQARLLGDGRPIVYFGHSLGAAIAAELAAESEPAVLILQSPFTSARDMGRRMLLPGLTLFWRAVSRISYDNVARVRQLGAPVWVAHGSADRLIPAAMGTAVFAAARHRGELLVVDGAGHNDVDDVGGEPYWRWLREALRSAVDQNVTRSPRDGVPTS